MPISFLENSATFLGCIFTLVVLCFLFDKNNFVFNLLSSILKESRDEVVSEIKQLEDKVKKKFQEAQDIEKVFSDSGKSEMTKEQLDMINLNQSLSLLSQSALFRAQSLDGVMKMLRKGDEFVSSFLYTFLYCLVVFVFDELYDSPVSDLGKFCLNYVFIFSLISVFIWILKWVYFWGHIDNRKNTPAKKYQFNLMISCALVIGLPALCILVMMLLEYALSLHFEYWVWILLFLGATLAIGLRAIYLFWNNEYRFTSFFVMSHFFCIMLSLFLMMAGSAYFASQTLFVDPIGVRRISLLTALLTGLILPFITPLCKLLIRINNIKDDNREDEQLYEAMKTSITEAQNRYMLDSQKRKNGNNSQM